MRVHIYRGFPSISCDGRWRAVGWLSPMEHLHHPLLLGLQLPFMSGDLGRRFLPATDRAGALSVYTPHYGVRIMLVTGPSQSVGSIPCGLFYSRVWSWYMDYSTNNYYYINEGDLVGSSHFKFKSEMVTKVSAGVGTDIGLDILKSVVGGCKINRCVFCVTCNPKKGSQWTLNFYMSIAPRGLQCCAMQLLFTEHFQLEMTFFYDIGLYTKFFGLNVS